MRILIVDDEPDIREALKELLEDVLGAHVDVARDGLAGLAMLREHAFHAVVSDERMPNLRGSEMLAAGPRDPPHVRILTTAYPEGRRLAEGCGATHFLPKPLDPSRLQRILQGAAAASSPGT